MKFSENKPVIAISTREYQISKYLFKYLKKNSLNSKIQILVLIIVKIL